MSEAEFASGLTLTATATSLIVGSGTLVTLTSGEAASSNLPITLTQNGSGSLTLPASVTLLSGQTQVTFTVTAQSAGSVTLTANAANRTPGSVTFTIAPLFAGVRIDSISPTSGNVGSSVTLTGDGFVVNPANSTDNSAATGNAVSFAGSAPATITQASATQLTVNVPNDANSGPITVTNSRGSASSTPFTVIRALDVSFTASPANLTVYQGANANVSLTLASTGTSDFTGLMQLTATNLPAGVTGA